MRFIVPMLIIFILNTSCRSSKNPIKLALKSSDPAIKYVVEDFTNYEVQIKLSEIIRTKDSVIFKDHEFNVNDANYFYPASSVKFPIALLTLEKINKISGISSQTKYRIEGDTMEYTIRDDVSKIFAVSDNDSYNRLYEFMGRDYINTQLRNKNIGPLRISHRLSMPNSDASTTKKITFLAADEKIMEIEPLKDTEIEVLTLKKLKKGKGFFKDSSLINIPMDFSEKNYLPISTLHNLMKRTIFPELFDLNNTFNINPRDRDFLLNAMSTLPRELDYDTNEYYDSYVKFFIYGDYKGVIPDDIKIYNKVGYAYGYLTDCAYIKDEKSQLEFILTATIHVNKNGIFNDDTYEYETVGIPFLAHISKEIYNQLTPKE